MKENAVVSGLSDPSLVSSVRYSVYGKTENTWGLVNLTL